LLQTIAIIPVLPRGVLQLGSAGLVRPHSSRSCYKSREFFEVFVRVVEHYQLKFLIFYKKNITITQGSRKIILHPWMAMEGGKENSSALLNEYMPFKILDM
jgi:hypothetical protein